MKVYLFVIDRGFVSVGLAETDPDMAFTWRLSPSRTIRQWGTVRGLAQLANEGPTEKTIMDDPVMEHLPYRSVIKIMECNEEKWLPHLIGTKPSPAKTARR